MSAWAEFGARKCAQKGAADQQQTSDWSKVAIKSWISSLKLVRLWRDSSTDSCCDYKEDQASGGV